MKNFPDRENKIAEYLIDRQLRIIEARKSFWSFCQLLSPDFYTESRPHLKDFCTVLQSFVEEKLLKSNGEPFKNLIIEKPPRHGKTRTLIHLSAWLLGRDNSFKIISTSYNDDEAQSFSKYTRNLIAEERNTPLQIIYKDIFSKARIKHGDASAHEWALDGQFFNYKGAGVGGTITGKGGNLILVDDPVKNAEEAFNENHLNKLWTWFTGTLLSRQEHGAFKIVCHTPWSKKDIGGRLQTEQADDWYVYSRPAKNDNGEMLCSDILDATEYEKLSRTMEPIIFSANYEMKRIDVKGLLYGDNFKTYAALPQDEEGKNLAVDRRSWCDTADTGGDYFCQIFGSVYKGYCYVIDVIHSQDDVKITEPLSAAKLLEHQTQYAKYESNSGGHAIATHIEKILTDDLKWYGTLFQHFTQTENKEARLLANSALVLDRIIMPVDWAVRWPSFYSAATKYMKKGKNVNDDVPDVLTMIVEDVAGGAVQQHFIIKGGLNR